jgi:2-hydroxy-3-keto-5-methylthiopentenyl-1-phosphate phosphatase
MRLIDADELIKDRVENDPVRIAAECAPTAFDKGSVIKELKSPYNYTIMAGRHVTTVDRSIEIVEKGGIE